jgi:hypothetical protein
LFYTNKKLIGINLALLISKAIATLILLILSHFLC